MTNSPSRAVKHALERPRRVAVLPIRWRRAILALAIATGLTTVLGSQIGASSAADGAETLFRSSTVHATKVAHTTRPTELGMRFNVTMPGTITGIRYFSTPASRGAHTGSLWAGRRSRIAKVRLPATSTPRWQTASFSHGVHVTPGRTYVVSYYAPHGRYAVQKHGFKARVANGHIRASKAAGVYRRGKGGGFPNQGAGQSNYLVDVIFVPDPDFHGSGLLPIPLPTLSLPAVPLPIVSSSAPATTTSAAPVSSAPPSTTAGAPSTAPSTSTAVPSIGTSPSSSSPPPSSSSGWPDGSNTGVPAGTTLTPYTGSCTISSAKTITGADMTSCDSVLIRAANVVISRSLLPLVDATAGGSASVTLTDDTVRAGNWSDGAIWGYNITASRVNVTGGQHSFHCAGNCTVTDSWLHDQYNPAGKGYHNNAFISNGGSNMVIRHNTLACTALLNSTNGGCTGDLSLFGDFEPIRQVTIDGSLFVANDSSISYCLYGGYDPGKKYGSNPTNVTVSNNVFQRGTNNKCGVYGPVTSFLAAGSGNTWSNNTWDDGGVLNP